MQLEMTVNADYQPTPIERYLGRQISARGGKLGSPDVRMHEWTDGSLYLTVTLGGPQRLLTRGYERRRGSATYCRVPTDSTSRAFTRIHRAGEDRKHRIPVFETTPESLLNVLRSPSLIFEGITFCNVHKSGHATFWYHEDELSAVEIDGSGYWYYQPLSKRLGLRKTSDFPEGLDYDYEKLRKEIQTKLLEEGKKSRTVIDDMLDFHVFKGK